MAREVVVAPAPVVERAWMLDAGDVVRLLGADLEVGLTTAEAERRLAETGPNVLEEAHHRPAWLVFAAQFTSTIVIVLLVAAGVMAILGDLRETLAILAVVVLNGIVGFVQEYRAEGAMEALERMTSPRARAMRDGRVRDVSAHGLVPGDVVVLATGDVVGADLRLVDVAALRVNEATLTGESEPVAETTRAAAGRGRVARCRASEHGVHGNGGHVRARCRGRGRDRDGHRARPDRGADRGTRGHAHPAPAAARLARPPPRARRHRPVARGVRDRTGDRRARRSDVPHRGEPGRLGHPGRPARHGHGGARAGSPPDGEPPRADPDAPHGGDAGLRGTSSAPTRPARSPRAGCWWSGSGPPRVPTGRPAKATPPRER